MVPKEINPFISNLRVKYMEVVKSIKGDGINAIVDSYLFETDTNARLFICADNREYIFDNLSIYARDFMMSMIYSLNRDYQYVIFPYEKIVELNKGKFSRRRYDDTMKELVKFGIIDLMDRGKGAYWFNPVFFVCGKRLDIYPECGIKVGTLGP